MTDPAYLSGFGNHFATEAVPGALPEGRNSPQRPAFGLYAEQLSGTAFTAPRHENRRSWLYRMRPTADHAPFAHYDGARMFSPNMDDRPPLAPNRLRWDRPEHLPGGTDFMEPSRASNRATNLRKPACNSRVWPAAPELKLTNTASTCTKVESWSPRNKLSDCSLFGSIKPDLPVLRVTASRKMGEGPLRTGKPTTSTRSPACSFVASFGKKRSPLAPSIM